jgi:IS5 family transposase
VRLDQIIDMEHELVRLAEEIDRAWLDGKLANRFSDKGRPGSESRFMVGLLLLKHIYGLSDERVFEAWAYDPYFQYLTGQAFFRHRFSRERPGLSHWCKRIGERLKLLLAESLRVAHATGALETKDLKRITVDTKMQPKSVSFPADAKLVHKAVVMLGYLAKQHGVLFGNPTSVSPSGRP